MGDPKNIWIIGHVTPARKETLEADKNFKDFCQENPELVAQILRENAEIRKYIQSSENPYKYLCDNPEIAKRLNLSNQQLLAVFWLSESKWNIIH